MSHNEKNRETLVEELQALQKSYDELIATYEKKRSDHSEAEKALARSENCYR